MNRLSALTLLTLLVAVPALGQDDFLDRMDREHRGDEPVASPAAAEAPRHEVTADEVTYARLDGQPISGYLARPAELASGPAVILIHEWWGLNDNIRSMADRLAGEGYLALAVDLYEGESAEDRENAGRLARAARDNPERGQENLRQAAAYLEDAAGATRLGVMGWCFGGGWSLQTALFLPDRIDAAVIYYGRVPTEPAELEPLQAPVLGLFGELDSGIPPETVRAFEAALDSLGKEASIHIYEGAGHAFANPSGTRYQATAAQDAWDKTLAFFDRHLR